MRNYILYLAFILCTTCVTYAQKVEILLKNGSRKSEQIKANSETQLFVNSGAIYYNEIESVKFDSDAPNDKRLQERLSSAGVKIYIREHQIIIDAGYINDTPQKGDKKIILICSDSLETLYKRIGQHLALMGYAIENASKDFLTIKTALRQTSKLNYSYFLNIIVTNHNINITAQWKLNNSILAGTRESGFVDWQFTNDKEGSFSMTVNSIIYNDLTKNFSDFDKLRINYE
jgi:hypothetical protein